MLLTTGQAAAELGCAVTTFRRLVRADLLPGLSRHGVRVMVPLQVVQALKERDPAALGHLKTPEIAVLRADVAGTPTGTTGGQLSGFSAQLGPDDLLAALKGRWRCDPRASQPQGSFP